MRKKIVVVVPVYNVEKYIKKCVNSLLNQNYSNYEIVLVDDGSTDESGKICDEYDCANYNVHAFHKKNGGLSDARNYAIKKVSGDYIIFIDSDDYVENNLLEYMGEYINSEDVDIVVSPLYDEKENSSKYVKERFTDDFQVFDAEEALEKMNYQNLFSTSACAKLIKMDLIKKFSFPNGMLYEDLATMFKIVGEANRIVVLDKPLYHYVQHNGSIRFSKWSSKVYDVITATEQLIDYVKKYYPEIYDSAIYRFFFSANEVYVRAFREEKYLELINPIKMKLKKYWKILKKSKKISKIQKVRFILMIHFPRTYRILWLTIDRWR